MQWTVAAVWLGVRVHLTLRTSGVTLFFFLCSTEEDINEATPFPRAERHAPSLLSDTSLSSYNGGVRRTWIQGEWASGRPKPERKRSMLANTLFCVLLLASVPLLVVYLKRGDALATFRDHSSMLPWLSSTGQSGSRGKYERSRPGKTEGEVMRADEQQPWRGREAERGAGRGVASGKEREKRALRAVEQAEKALTNARGGNVASSRPLRPMPLTLPVHGQPPRHANAAGKRGVGMTEMELKYEAAEREVRALEGKVGHLERKVVRERVGSAASQAAAVANAEAEITRLQHELSTLETQVSARRHWQRSVLALCSHLTACALPCLAATRMRRSRPFLRSSLEFACTSYCD